MGESTKTARITRVPITVCPIADCLEERPIAECRPTRLLSLEHAPSCSLLRERILVRRTDRDSIICLQSVGLIRAIFQAQLRDEASPLQ
jgi:hypothetical protein